MTDRDLLQMPQAGWSTVARRPRRTRGNARCRGASALQRKVRPMTTPQIVMAAWLAFLCLMGAFKMAKDGETPAKAVGGFIGIAGRYATIAAIAWWGGFWA